MRMMAKIDVGSTTFSYLAARFTRIILSPAKFGGRQPTRSIVFGTQPKQLALDPDQATLALRDEMSSRGSKYLFT
jgi:hypothetical protein